MVGGAIKFASDRYGGALREMRMLANGKSVVSALGSKLVYLFVGYGQSLSVGITASAGQLYTTTALYTGSVLRFNKGTRPIGEQTVRNQDTAIPSANLDRLVPLTAVADGTLYYETDLETLAYRLMSGNSMRSISIATGVGGSTIDQMSRGTVPYFNIM
jgi:hypothetical protein